MSSDLSKRAVPPAKRETAKHAEDSASRLKHELMADALGRVLGKDSGNTATAGAPRVLLAHQPRAVIVAAPHGVDLMLTGHTHGGQICLPGSIPITLDSVLPRRFGAGLWRYHEMTGYTSVGVGSSIVPIRLNCPPEITLHRLHSAPH